MNSYETRLNNLKQQTNNLENKDLRTEIENFSLKWSETYQLISKWNIFLLVLRYVCFELFFEGFHNLKRTKIFTLF